MSRAQVFARVEVLAAEMDRCAFRMGMYLAQSVAATSLAGVAVGLGALDLWPAVQWGAALLSLLMGAHAYVMSGRVMRRARAIRDEFRTLEQALPRGEGAP